MTSLRDLRFFSTAQHDCSYLDDQRAATLFVDPHAHLSSSTYSALSDLGFRRSGNFIYRPNCPDCFACIPVRIPAEAFAPNRSQQRVLKRNTDVVIEILAADFTEERYALYDRYIRERHRDGDMYPPSREQFNSFLLSNWSQTCFVEFRLEGKLIAVAVCDWIEQGISATYTFFDTNLASRSLGTLAILWQIETCRQQGLYGVYLGYWIRQSTKMRYKSMFRPMELLIDREWLRVR